MRQSHPKESLAGLCALFGVSRQAFYEAEFHDNKTSIANMIVLTLVKELRKDIPMLGTRKLVFMLKGMNLIDMVSRWEEINSLNFLGSMVC